MAKTTWSDVRVHTVFVLGVIVLTTTQGLKLRSWDRYGQPRPFQKTYNKTALCPTGWLLAFRPAMDFRTSPSPLCLRVDSQDRTWPDATSSCGTSKGFLVKLDTVITVGNVPLTVYLRQRGLSTVWTGMHHYHGSLLWDDLRPRMVKPYLGGSRIYGWRKRGWGFDEESFEEGSTTCGVLEIDQDGEDEEEEAQVEAGGDQGTQEQGVGEYARLKRSSSQLTTGQLQAPGRATQPLRVDSEDAILQKTAMEEMKLESFKQFLSNQGFQEKFVDSIGDSHSNGESAFVNKEQNIDNRFSSQMTTLGTTTTDQSQLEDDDYHVVTKRSTGVDTTTRETLPAELTTGASASPVTSSLTSAPDHAAEKSARGTSLPAYTESLGTTASPGAAARIDELLGHLLQASMVDSPPAGGFGPGLQPSSLPIDLHKSLESQSSGIDSNEFLKSLLKKATVAESTTHPPAASGPENAADLLTKLLDDALSPKTSTSVPKNQVEGPAVISESRNPQGLWTGVGELNGSAPFLNGISAGALLPSLESNDTITTTQATRPDRTSPLLTEMSTEKRVGLMTQEPNSISDPDLPISKYSKDHGPLPDISSFENANSAHDSSNSGGSHAVIDEALPSTSGSTTTRSGVHLDSLDSINGEAATSSQIHASGLTSNREFSQPLQGTEGIQSTPSPLFDKNVDYDLNSNDSSEVVNDSSEVFTSDSGSNGYNSIDVDNLESSNITRNISSNQNSIEIFDTTNGNHLDQEHLSSHQSPGLFESESLISNYEDPFSPDVIDDVDSGTTNRRPSSFDSSERLGGGLLLKTLNSIKAGLQAPPPNELTLDQCETEHASVCMTEAIEELTLVGHCDRNWFGHRLLDRCYKLLGFIVTEIEARQWCLRHSATLASVDADFYGNVTSLLIATQSQPSGFGSRAWVDTTRNLNEPVDGLCSAIEDGQVVRVDCRSLLPFVCEKEVRFQDSHAASHVLDRHDVATYVQNMTSFHPQALWCPLRMTAFDDVIIWYKDGRPVLEETDDGSTIISAKNGQMPNSLDLNLNILERTGEVQGRIPKPPLLQGEYWCEIWRQEPFQRVVSHKIFLKFTDVITLHGFITTEPVDHVTAAMFNRMGQLTGLPAIMERQLATMNKNITHHLRSRVPDVRDVITIIKHASPETGQSEFVTYICTASNSLTSHMRGDLVDLYLPTFYDALTIHENEIRREWNLTLPLRQAIEVTMADMCPGARLEDADTGKVATFPSTPVNNRALSLEQCNQIHAGLAWCSGDHRSGARWSSWRVTGWCLDHDQSASSESGDVDDSSEENKRKIDDIIDLGDGFVPSKLPNPALLELDDIEIEDDNVADVTDRLAQVLEESGDLSESDIEAVAQVVDRIVAVRRPPAEVNEKLVQTVNKVLDAPTEHLIRAEEKTKAPSRLIDDLEKFGERANIGSENHARFVTPNVALDMWDLGDPSDVVIGFGATHTPTWESPLTEPRIQEIRDKEWAQINLANFDIAIQLPESLVRNSIRYSESSLRLTMYIFRKTSLFLPAKESDSGHVNQQSRVNSAIISASLGGKKIRGLEESVRLIFKPFTVSEDRESSSHCVFWDTRSGGRPRWSDEGCVYNGTMNGRDVCLCDHLTNFAILLDFYGDDHQHSSEHETSLTILSLIGLSLSIFGLAVTIITFMAFKKIRQGRAQHTLFNMAVALLCFQTTFLVGVKQTSIAPVCLTVAVLLHYFILVSFAWMLIEAVLQYLTFVKVLGTYISRYTLKTVLPAWGAPLIPVLAVLVTDYRLYLGRSNYCWMDLQAFYYAFAIPVGTIIAFNIVMFFVIIISLVTRPKGLRSNQANSKRRETNLKAAFTIFVLLGLTWMFGYLAVEDARLPFQYTFTVLSSLQGFLIFVLMVLRRRQVREEWAAMCCIHETDRQEKQKKLSPQSSSCNSSSQSLSNSRTLPSFVNHTYNGESLTLQPPGFQRQTSITV